MQKIDLQLVEHNVKVGDTCGLITPNVTEDCLLVDNGEVVGFYLRNLAKHSPKAAQLAEIANREFRTKRVPKSTMKRSSGFTGGAEKEVLQYSTIIGSVPPKPHMKRPYPTMSSVHNVKTAQNFVKAMLLLCGEAEELIKKYTPEIYEKQAKIIEEQIPEQWRFGKLFTSSISNYNISAPFHVDAGNLRGCLNVIISKRECSTGGNTTVPDYGATFDSADGAMLVYPAWRNIHGVTPIVPTREGGYRNTLVFYPLKAFAQYMEKPEGVDAK